MRNMLLALLVAGCVACAVSGPPTKSPERLRPRTDVRYLCIGFTASWCDETWPATLSSVDRLEGLCGVVQMLTSPPKELPEAHHKQPPCEGRSRKYRDLPPLNEHPT